MHLQGYQGAYNKQDLKTKELESTARMKYVLLIRNSLIIINDLIIKCVDAGWCGEGVTVQCLSRERERAMIQLRFCQSRHGHWPATNYCLTAQHLNMIKQSQPQHPTLSDTKLYITLSISYLVMNSLPPTPTLVIVDIRTEIVYFIRLHLCLKLWD